MRRVISIGTRSSQLATWQAEHVKAQLEQEGFEAELRFIKSEGDIDLKTPLYEMGVQGIFTRSLDIALLNNQVDIAVHSMKDVPTQLPVGIIQAAVLPRASHYDILVQKEPVDLKTLSAMPAVIATSSTRRRAQWLRRFPHHRIENLRGNVNSRLQKLAESNWDGAIFAEAGLERIGLRPPEAITLDWMLPAPTQGTIVIACRENDPFVFEACKRLNDDASALCAKIEKDFLRTLKGGCTAPIGCLAELKGGEIHFRGNLCSPDGLDVFDISGTELVEEASELGSLMGETLLGNGGSRILEQLHKA